MIYKISFAVLAYALWVLPAAANIERFDQIERLFFGSAVEQVAALITRLTGA